MRDRFWSGNGIENVHLLAIPFRSKHTGENIAISVASLLEAVVGEDWSQKVIGISTDGAASMVGRVSGAVTRLDSMMLKKVYRVWCGAHQFYLAIHAAYRSTMKQTFQEPLHSLISFLRRQTNLKAEMGTLCTTVPTTRWLSIGEVCRWLISNRIRVQQYLVEKSQET